MATTLIWPPSSSAWRTAVGPHWSPSFHSCPPPSPLHTHTHTVLPPHAARGSLSKPKSEHVPLLLRTLRGSYLMQSKSQRSYEALQDLNPWHLPDFIFLTPPLTHASLDVLASSGHLRHTRDSPASGPWHLLFFLARAFSHRYPQGLLPHLLQAFAQIPPC